MFPQLFGAVLLLLVALAHPSNAALVLPIHHRFCLCVGHEPAYSSGTGWTRLGVFTESTGTQQVQRRTTACVPVAEALALAKTAALNIQQINPAQ